MGAIKISKGDQHTFDIRLSVAIEKLESARDQLKLGEVENAVSFIDAAMDLQDSILVHVRSGELEGF